MPRAVQMLSWPIPTSRQINILQSAIESIEQIKILDKPYYDKFERNYGRIKEGLTGLIDHCNRAALISS